MFGRNFIVSMVEIFDGISNIFVVGEWSMKNYVVVWVGVNLG